MRVVCDVAAVERTFDYLVPNRLIERFGSLQVGMMLRVPFHGRQVAAWVVEVDCTPPEGVELREATKISSLGPPAEVIDLAGWASWRWAGRVQTFLRAASPPSMVATLPAAARSAPASLADGVGARVSSALAASVSLMRLPPAVSPMEVLRAAALRGNVLVVCPTNATAARLADGLRRSEVPVVLHPDGWARGAAGCSVIGTRNAVFAPVGGLGAIVVIDEHDETLQSEGSPTWNARDVAIERGRRAGVPVVLVSPTPSLEALVAVGALGAGGEVAAGAEIGTGLVTIDRARERNGWGRLSVIDRRDDDPRTGLFSEDLARVLRSDARVVCVLNRTGRAQLLACKRCGTLATCEACDGAVHEVDEAGRPTLRCSRCATQRPVVCGECGTTVLKTLRMGVSKAREQLESLVQEPVEEITGESGQRPAGTTPRRVLVGTTAALQRLTTADVVAFLEFDQELSAPRYRANEQALALLAKASRLVGGHRGRVLVQTRQPDHPVLRAALLGDPTVVSDLERTRRQMLGLPPFVTLVAVGGSGGAAYIESLRAVLDREIGGDGAGAGAGGGGGAGAGASAGAGGGAGVTIDQPAPDQWIVRGRDRSAVLDALAATRRPAGRLRLQVDPMRLPH